MVPAWFRSFFDVRPGEYGRTFFMSLYLLLVLLAYYILKPVSRALFLNKFDIDKLPYLYVLIAVAGGLLAYVYTRVAVRSSLQTAVAGAMAFSVGMLVLIWWLIGMNQPWVYYFFNIWVSLFSVMLVSQGWLVAANVFTPREAKRLYGLLGAGAVIGAAFGGEFTARAVKYIGPRGLLLASAVFVVLAYVAFRFAAAQKGVSLKRVRGAESEDANVEMLGILRSIKTQRHLQVIVAIMILTFIVDVSIEYQFNAFAKLAYSGHDSTGAGLTAFLGSFYGIYLNLITIVLQIVFTAFVVQRLGVGGTLQIMPVAIGVTSIATFFFSGVWAAGALRLTEAATRYTLNRTGMELLYLPLPLDLKNRTKAFIDIFVDRFGRGLGGMLLVLLTGILHFPPKWIALVTVGFAIPWIVLSQLASREYIATVRRRLSSRRLDFAEARFDPSDPAALRLLEEAASGANARQAAYAIGLLAEIERYDIRPLLARRLSDGDPLLRQKIFEVAAASKIAGFEQSARAELAREDGAREPAIAYLLAVSREPAALVSELLAQSDFGIAEAAAHAAGSGGGHPVNVNVLDMPWFEPAAHDPDPRKRRLAAAALALAGERGAPLVRELLQDSDLEVARQAVSSAARLRDRSLIFALLPLVARSGLRADVLEALASYGDGICGTLSDLMSDESLPVNIRRQAPRVLKLIRTQRSVDVLVQAIGHGDLSIRESALRALNSIRNRRPDLNVHQTFVTDQILTEARYYFELNASLRPFIDQKTPRTAAGLLARTIEQRLEQAVERLFRLLGLRYPPVEIYSVYLAWSRGHGDELGAALEFLDETLDRDLKRVVLPMLDRPEHVEEFGRRLFGCSPQTAESAIRELIASRDPWLVACSIASARELKLSGLVPQIRQASRNASQPVRQIADEAVAVLT
jgi:ATP/ADP translocase/HEAT repeat protein